MEGWCYSCSGPMYVILCIQGRVCRVWPRRRRDGASLESRQAPRDRPSGTSSVGAGETTGCAASRRCVAVDAAGRGIVCRDGGQPRDAGGPSVAVPGESDFVPVDGVGRYARSSRSSDRPALRIYYYPHHWIIYLSGGPVSNGVRWESQMQRETRRWRWV